MKKLFLAVAAVAMVFATSCKKENVNEPVNPEEIPANSFLCEIENGSATQKILSRIGDGMGTMATIDGGRYIVWENGDVISVNGIDFTNNQPTAARGAEGARAYFERGSAYQCANGYYAFYPSNIQTKPVSPATETPVATGELEDEFTYDPQSPADHLPMFAYNANNHWLTFHNICAVLEITIPNVANCNKIVLSADANICGSFTVTDYNTANPYASVTSTGDATKSITVKAQAGETFAVGSKVYVAIPQGTNVTYWIEFFNGATSLYKNGGKKITVVANVIYPVEVAIPTSGLLPGLFTVGQDGSGNPIKVKFTAGNLYGVIQTGSSETTYALHIEVNQTDRADDWNENHISLFYFAENQSEACASSKPSNQSYLFCDGLDASRTLTVDNINNLSALNVEEFRYLFYTRAHASNLYRDQVYVDGTYANCVIIAPDDYDYVNNPLSGITDLSCANLTSLGLVILRPTSSRDGEDYGDEENLTGYYLTSTRTNDEIGVVNFWGGEYGGITIPKYKDDEFSGLGATGAIRLVQRQQ